MTKKPADGVSEWIDPDDAPALDDAFFDRAEIREGDKIVRPGRPRLDRPKAQVTLRLDSDVLAYFKASGPGWQTRINDALKERIAKA
jgi:uncharacterized protein (DUF4415 family)